MSATNKQKQKPIDVAKLNGEVRWQPPCQAGLGSAAATWVPAATMGAAAQRVTTAARAAGLLAGS